jgi:hypothetical protein
MVGCPLFPTLYTGDVTRDASEDTKMPTSGRNHKTRVQSAMAGAALSPAQFIHCCCCKTHAIAMLQISRPCGWTQTSTHQAPTCQRNNRPNQHRQLTHTVPKQACHTAMWQLRACRPANTTMEIQNWYMAQNKPIFGTSTRHKPR